MGELNVRVVNTQKQLNDFTKCLLRDVYLLEQMLEEQWFDTEQMHIGRKEGETTVDDIMITEPVTVAPERSIWDAMRLMKENRVSCLPVVKNDKLIGIVSEGDFL